MLTNSISYLTLVALAVISVAFIYLHWRYHPQATPLDSFVALQKRLRQGKPTLLQFHAPM